MEVLIIQHQLFEKFPGRANSSDKCVYPDLFLCLIPLIAIVGVYKVLQFALK